MSIEVKGKGIAGCIGVLVAAAVWNALLALVVWFAWNTIAPRAQWPDLRYVEALAALLLVGVLRGVAHSFRRRGAA